MTSGLGLPTGGRRLAGQLGVTLVGRSDLSFHEAPQRCRMANHNTGLHWPATKRVTILLSPSDLPKRGTHADLSKVQC